MATDTFNPYPGLRPFRQDEDHLLFGREEQVIRVLTLLRQHRFTAVVGTSGSGKSSLIRAGVLPELIGGTMTSAGSAWEVAVMRPGGDPIGNLAAALCDAGLYDTDTPAEADRVETTLRDSSLGLMQAIRQSDLVDDADAPNVLVVVDQFEEIFRFAETTGTHADEGAAFVALLLEAARQSELPIFVTLTMRSDYLGDCARFSGLSEAVNAGEYLIPQLSREQLRRAIEGPARVAGGEISQRLVQLLLNDVAGQDQLPVLQHALMRTWQAATATTPSGVADLEHYLSVGAMTEALSLHADEIYEAFSAEAQQLCELIFKSLTELGDDNRGIRRPVSVSELGAIADASDESIAAVVDEFRVQGCTFLMPPEDTPLSRATMIDLSHESLMRVWRRLTNWVADEAQSARTYRRLAETAELHHAGQAALYHSPDLEIASAWRTTTQPNKTWGKRYHPAFDGAMAFLDRSVEAAEAATREREAQRSRELQQARELAETQQLRAEESARAAARLKRFTMAISAVAAFAVLAGVVAVIARNEATESKMLAERQLYISDMNQTAQAVHEGDILRARVLLDRHRPEAGEHDHRAWEWFHWWRTAHAHRHELRIFQRWPVGSIELGPDRKSVYVRELGGNITPVSTTDFHQLAARRPGPTQLLAQFGISEEFGRRFLISEGWGVDSNLPGIAYSKVVEIRALDNGLIASHLSGAHLSADGSAYTAGLMVAPVPAGGPSDAALVSADRTGTLALWRRTSPPSRTPTGTYSHRSIRFGRSILDVSVSPDGRLVALALGGSTHTVPDQAPAGSVAVINLEDETAITWLGPSTEESQNVAISPAGSWLAASGGTEAATIRVLRIASGSVEPAPATRIKAQWPVTSLALSPDGARLAAGFANRNGAAVWELADKDPAPAFRLKTQPKIHEVEFGIDSDQLITASNSSEVVQFWDLKTARTYQPIRGVKPSVSATNRGAMTVSGSGFIFEAADRAMLRIDATGDFRRDVVIPASDVVMQALSANGAAHARIRADGSLTVTDLASGDVLFERTLYDATAPFARMCREALRLHGCIGGLAVSNDGLRVAWTFAPGTLVDQAGIETPPTFMARLEVADVKTGMVTAIGEIDDSDEGHVRDGHHLRFSPDGAYLTLAYAGDNTAVIDTAAVPARYLYMMQGWGPESPAAFAPEGDRIAIGSGNTTVRIHELADGAITQELHGHRADVLAVAWSPDGKTLGSGAHDGALRLWDTETGQSRFVLRDAHTAPIHFVGITADNRSVITSDANGVGRWWLSASPEEAVDNLDVLLNRWRDDPDNLDKSAARALERFPDHPRVLAHLARAKQFWGQRSEAMQVLDRAAATNPAAERELLLTRLEVGAALGRWDDVEATATRLLELRPDDQILLGWRGTARQRLGNTSGAAADFRHALEAHPLLPLEQAAQLVFGLGAIVPTALESLMVPITRPNGIQWEYDIAPREGPIWAFADNNPGPDWYQPEFNDSNWSSRQVPIRGRHVRREATNPNGGMWARHRFELEEDNTGPLVIALFGSSNASVYVDGKLLAHVPERGGAAYWHFPLPPTPLQQGPHLLAVYMGSPLDGLPFHFDVGLYKYMDAARLNSSLRVLANGEAKDPH